MIINKTLRTFVVGLGCGLLISVATLAKASESTLEAYLFKVKYIINGAEAKLDEEYVTLNYEGHAYVPIRFITENAGLNVGYDANSQTILVNNVNSKGQEVMVDNKAPNVSISNLIVAKDPQADTTIVTGQISVANLETANIKGNLSFYSVDGKKLGEVIIDGDFKKGMQEFAASGVGNFASYEKVIFNVGALNYRILR